MRKSKDIHTTVDIETYKYLKRMQAEHNLNLNTVIKMLVEKNIQCKAKLEKKILREVINYVIEQYVNGEYYSEY